MHRRVIIHFEYNDTRGMKRMKTKKPYKGLGFKQFLFIYLAITKMLYWINIIIRLDSFSEFGNVFINRMLSQDILVIIALVAMYFLDRYIFSRASDNDWRANLKLYLIGMVLIVALVAGYFLLMQLFFEAVIAGWPRFIGELVLIYFILAVFVHLKERLKKKEAQLYLPEADSDEAKIAMLKSLCGAGVLTQEECETKCGLITADSHPA